MYFLEKNKKSYFFIKLLKNNENFDIYIILKIPMNQAERNEEFEENEKDNDFNDLNIYAFKIQKLKKQKNPLNLKKKLMEITH